VAEITAAGHRAIAIAAELGVKPSRTVKAMQALAVMPLDFAPRKGSEGRRPQVTIEVTCSEEVGIKQSHRNMVALLEEAKAYASANEAWLQYSLGTYRGGASFRVSAGFVGYYAHIGDSYSFTHKGFERLESDLSRGGLLDSRKDWGYVVAGSPKRVISLPEENPEEAARSQGITLLGHLVGSGAKPVGTPYELRQNGKITRISPVAVVQRYFRMFPDVNRRLTDHISVRFGAWDTVTVAFLEWDDVAEDVNPTTSEECGSARTLVEFLTEMDYKAEEEGRRGRNYR
jgi:hypothetical protein